LGGEKNTRGWRKNHKAEKDKERRIEAEIKLFGGKFKLEQPTACAGERQDQKKTHPRMSGVAGERLGTRGETVTKRRGKPAWSFCRRCRKYRLEN